MVARDVTMMMVVSSLSSLALAFADQYCPAAATYRLVRGRDSDHRDVRTPDYVSLSRSVLASPSALMLDEEVMVVLKMNRRLEK